MKIVPMNPEHETNQTELSAAEIEANVRKALACKSQREQLFSVVTCIIGSMGRHTTYNERRLHLALLNAVDQLSDQDVSKCIVEIREFVSHDKLERDSEI